MNMTVEEIIAGCKKKERKAQKALFDRYHRGLLGVCQRYCRDKNEAEEVLLDGFMQIFKKIKTLKDDKTLEAWMRRVIVNKAIDQFRKNKTKADERSIEDMNTEISVDMDQLSSLSEKDILQTVQKLPNGYRMIFNLYAIEGYNHKEIGKKLGISESTSKTQLLRARKALIAMLEHENLK